MEALQADFHLEFALLTSSKLVMIDSAKGLDVAQRQVDSEASFGSEQQVLDTDSCINVEPALATSAARWAGGVYPPSEQVGDCAAFCTQLAQAIRVRHPHSRLMFNTTITGAILEAGRIVSCQSNQGNQGNQHDKG